MTGADSSPYKKTFCELDLEFLCLSMQPFYLRRELGNVIVCTAYVSPSGSLAQCIQTRLPRTPVALAVILGDFNHCRIEQTLPGFHQHINSFPAGDNKLTSLLPKRRLPRRLLTSFLLIVNDT